MKRSKFSLSTQKPFTLNLGDLVPINVTEVLPSDTVQQQTKVLTRFSPLAAPVFHSCTSRIHHFYCSSKNLADFYSETETDFDWEAFITGGPNNADVQTVPTLNTTGTKGDLLDYLGLPASDAPRTFDASGVAINALPVAMFNFCFNEYFRDQDLVTARAWDDLTIPKIAWAKDVATTARATPQRGAQVTLPLGDTAPITGIGLQGATTYGTETNIKQTGAVLDATGQYGKTSVDQLFYMQDPDNTAYPLIQADLSNATGIDPIEFRRAMALQSWAEIRQKYGARYVEYMRYLGGRMLRPPDRPEYLGGGVAPVQFSEVLQTALDSGSGVGDMFGHGISLMRGNKYRRTFDEHGYIMSFMSIRPKAVYQDGIHKLWLKQDKEDFFTKELELIGMQPMQIEEIYADPATPGETFAWQENYYDYRTGHSSVAGDFNDTLDYWHLARQFASEPSLNSSFVECSPSNRIFQSSASDTIWCLAHNSIVARRPVRRNPEPRII